MLMPILEHEHRDALQLAMSHLVHEGSFAALFEAAVDAIVIADDRGIIERVNASCERMFGYKRGELVGRNVSVLMHEATGEQHDDYLLRYGAGGAPQVIGRGRQDVARRSDGSEFPLHLSVSEFTAEGKTWYVGMIRDISDLVAAERRRDELIHELRASREQFRLAATRDALTGLANRTQFLDDLDRSIGGAVPAGAELAVAFIDLDRFKLINDTQGHDAGDELLREVGRRLVGTARPDDVVARLAGDEFVVLLCGEMSRASLTAELDRILEALSVPITLPGGVVNLTVSIGAALYPADAREPEQLIRAADIAMYMAKREGGSSVRVHSAEMTEYLSRRDMIERELRAAIAADGLEVHYQPIVRLSDWSVRHVEALVRWHHPVHGAFSPADWIPIAEETGLISAVGAFVRQQSLTDLQSWDALGRPPMRVAVNISPLEFRGRNLAQSILEQIERSGLQPARLLVELTESALGDAAREIVDDLHVLRAAGIETAIDDFGTGHSALSHIASLPADVLKIDRSFVKPLPGDAGSRAIVEGIVMLAHRLGLEIVAEGVETTQQADYLTEIGCDFGQGFFFARPMSSDQLVGWLERVEELAA